MTTKVLLSIWTGRNRSQESPLSTMLRQCSVDMFLNNTITGYVSRSFLFNPISFWAVHICNKPTNHSSIPSTLSFHSKLPSVDPIILLRASWWFVQKHGESNGAVKIFEEALALNNYLPRISQQFLFAKRPRHSSYTIFRTPRRSSLEPQHPFERALLFIILSIQESSLWQEMTVLPIWYVLSKDWYIYTYMATNYLEVDQCDFSSILRYYLTSWGSR